MSASVSTTSTRHLGLSRTTWAIIAMGLLLRVGCVVAFSGNLSQDPDTYARLSRSIVDGNGLSVVNSDLPSAFRPPMLPLLLAVPQWLSASTEFSVAIVMLVASSFLLIGTAKLSDEIGLPEVMQVACLCLVSCDPLLILYCTFPMTEVPTAAALVWACFFGIRTCRHLNGKWPNAAQIRKGLVAEMETAISVASGCERKRSDADEATPSRGLKPAILCGVAFGVGGLCRPILFPACAFATVVMFLFALGYFGPERRRSLLLSLVPAFVAGLLLLPWVARNYQQWKAFVPATTHGGYTLLLGNNPVFYAEVVNEEGQPNWKGPSLDRWTASLEAEMQAAGISPADQVARDRWMYARAQANIAADPHSFLAACVLRVKRFWAVTPSSLQDRSAAVRLMVGTFYGVLWAGLFIQAFDMCAGRSRSENALTGNIFLWVCVLAFLLVHTFYWTNTRMRAPVMPVLTVLSCLGWSVLGPSRWRFRS